MTFTLIQTRKTRQTLLTLLAMSLALCHTEALKAESFVIGTDSGANASSLKTLTGALNSAGHETCLVGNESWPVRPDRDALREASLSYDEGTNFYLDLKLKAAAKQFKVSYDAYRALLKNHPFNEVLLERTAEAGFYWARSLFEKNERRKASQTVGQIFRQLPTVTPSPSIFPPDFRQYVETLRSRRKRLSKLTIRALPVNARISLNGINLEPGDDGVTTLREIEQGSYQVAVGLNEFGYQSRTITIQGSETTIDVDLFNPPEISQVPMGKPWTEKQLRPIRRRHGNAETLIWVSDTELDSSQAARVAFIQWLSDGKLTGAFVFDNDQPLSEGGGRRLAVAIAEASLTEEFETFRVGRDDVNEDDELRSAMLRDLGINDIGVPPIKGEVLAKRLGLYLGTGAGLAVKVTHPGFAPTPLLLRSEILFPINDTIMFGIGGRAQLTKFALLGEPFIRWDLETLSVYSGVAIGTITQTITDTENRNRSTQKWVGPSFGLSFNLSGLHFGMNALSTLVPDQSIQFDLVLGTEFEL